MRIGIVAALTVLSAAGVAKAASREVQYGPTPAWVAPAPVTNAAEAPANAAPNAPLRQIFLDSQLRFAHDGDDSYRHYRIKILSPQGLAIGNLIAAWNPSTDDLTIHTLKIYRGSEVIDVLATNKFQVIQREDRLEASSLDGILTAALQAPGLQVGDELEFAATLHHKDIVFHGLSQGFAQLPVAGAPGVYRVRAVWPADKPVRAQASADLKAAPIETEGDERETIYELKDPASAVLTDGAPARFNVRRFIQFSEFQSWGEVSAALAPLFDQAETLAPDSPLRQQAAAIAKSTSDPAGRVEAALKLVEDQVRYVYVGLEGANYRPQAADQTWRTRFGDCKAKTALLIALLRELGIPAEAMLVNAQSADGLDERLPTPEVFNHAVVRVEVGGATYWLDSTRIGDHRLNALQPPDYGWALPVRTKGATLERIPRQGPMTPLLGVVLDIDATSGFSSPAKVKAEQILRGGAADAVRAKIVEMSPEDAQRALKAYWQGQYTWIEPDTASWHEDEWRGALILTLEGHGSLKWRGNDREGHDVAIEGLSFPRPDEVKRPAEQDQTAPWVNNFPMFIRWTAVVRLPESDPRWRWDYTVPPAHMTLGGEVYWRAGELRGGILVSSASVRAAAPEVTAAEVAELNRDRSKVDTSGSYLFQMKSSVPTKRTPQALHTAFFANPAAGSEVGEALKAMAAKDDATALVKLNAAVRAAPEAFSLFQMRASVLERLGRHGEALADYEEVLSVDPLDETSLKGRDVARAALDAAK